MEAQERSTTKMERCLAAACCWYPFAHKTRYRHFLLTADFLRLEFGNGHHICTTYGRKGSSHCWHNGRMSETRNDLLHHKDRTGRWCHSFSGSCGPGWSCSGPSCSKETRPWFEAYAIPCQFFWNVSAISSKSEEVWKSRMTSSVPCAFCSHHRMKDLWAFRYHGTFVSIYPDLWSALRLLSPLLLLNGALSFRLRLGHSPLQSSGSATRSQCGISWASHISEWFHWVQWRIRCTFQSNYTKSNYILVYRPSWGQTVWVHSDCWDPPTCPKSVSNPCDSTIDSLYQDILNSSSEYDEPSTILLRILSCQWAAEATGGWWERKAAKAGAGGRSQAACWWNDDGRQPWWYRQVDVWGWKAAHICRMQQDGCWRYMPFGKFHEVLSSWAASCSSQTCHPCTSNLHRCFHRLSIPE